LAAAGACFARALAVGVRPTQVTTDRAPSYPRVLDEYVPAALHSVEQYANKSRRSQSRPAESLATADAGTERFRSAQTLAAGHAFVQNLRRGHHEIATDEPAHDRLRIAFDALAASV
jgi:IS6 family transposase